MYLFFGSYKMAQASIQDKKISWDHSACTERSDAVKETGYHPATPMGSRVPWLLLICRCLNPLQKMGRFYRGEVVWRSHQCWVATGTQVCCRRILQPCSSARAQHSRCKAPSLSNCFLPGGGGLVNCYAEHCLGNSIHPLSVSHWASLCGWEKAAGEVSSSGTYLPCNRRHWCLNFLPQGFRINSS